MLATTYTCSSCIVAVSFRWRCASAVMILHSCDNSPGATGIICGAGMSEHVAQTAPMPIVAGLAAGWLSEVVARRGRDGLLRDMALGIGGPGQP